MSDEHIGKKILRWSWCNLKLSPWKLILG